jgi:hypothetical protein
MSVLLKTVRQNGRIYFVLQNILNVTGFKRVSGRGLIIKYYFSQKLRWRFETYDISNLYEKEFSIFLAYVLYLHPMAFL